MRIRLSAVVAGVLFALSGVMASPANALPVPCDAVACPPPRIDTGAGFDHPMEEDESPWRGLLGGTLVSYSDGEACYTDRSCSDGSRWSLRIGG